MIVSSRRRHLMSPLTKATPWWVAAGSGPAGQHAAHLWEINPVSMVDGTEEGVKDKIKSSITKRKQLVGRNDSAVMSSILADKVNIISCILFSIIPVSSIITSSWNKEGGVNWGALKWFEVLKAERRCRQHELRNHLQPSTCEKWPSNRPKPIQGVARTFFFLISVPLSLPLHANWSIMGHYCHIEERSTMI